MGCLLGSADSEKNEEEQKSEQLRSNKEQEPSHHGLEWSSPYPIPMTNTPPVNFSGNRWPASNAYPRPQAANLSSSSYPIRNDVKYKVNISEFPALPTYEAPTQRYLAKNTANKWTKYSSDYVPLDSDYSCFSDTSSSSSYISSNFTQYKPVSNLKTTTNYKNLNYNSERNPGLNQRQASRPLIKETNQKKSQPQVQLKLNGIFSSDASAPSKVYSELVTYILSYTLSKPKSEPIIIPNSFQDISSYIYYFGSAFYIELHAILDQALEEAFLANKYDLNLTIKEKENHARFSSVSTDELKFENEIQINDIVIIIPLQNKAPQNFEKIKENNIIWTLGLVDQNKEHKYIIWLNPTRDQWFKKSKKYTVSVIGNITSLKRELSVLDKIKNFSLLTQILNPPIYEPRLQFNGISELYEIIQSKYNESQVEAIANSINSRGKISLIQGPPGTGKTRTVAGILSGLYAVNRNIKVLVCAQSNAAVDEIAWTVLREGLFDIDGNIRHDINLLRIGEKRKKHELGVEEEVKTSKEIESGINSIKLNILVDEKLSKKNLRDPTFEIKKAIEKYENLVKKYKELEKKEEKDESEKMKKMSKIEFKIDKLLNKINMLKATKELYINKKTKYNSKLIQTADIMFCTLSGSGSMSVVQNVNSVSYLIIDEACQSLELSSLIPFQYNPTSAILIGDPKQLPATTFADKSKTNKYDRSFFERMMKCRIRPVVLNIQYRMAKEISDFTSMTFYDNQIQCSESVISRKDPNWIYPNGPLFFNLETSEEMRAEDSLSYYNKSEADFVIKLYTLLKHRIQNINAHIGIISPYKGQVKFIEDLLYQRFGHSWKKNCEVSSVDGFQGREVDLVILSTVRSESIGFLRDERRMNVAISRAKYGMYAIGNQGCLSTNPKWRSLIEYCRELNKYECCNSFKDVTLLFNKKTYY